jgi:hypothetical protein
MEPFVTDGYSLTRTQKEVFAQLEILSCLEEEDRVMSRVPSGLSVRRMKDFAFT